MGGKHQVVLIDHGLYIRESEKFRQQNCELWKAMFLGDRETIEEICREWGVRDTELFASLQLMKPFTMPGEKVISNVAAKPSREEIIRMQMQTKQRIRTMLADTDLVPRELIFVGRNMNLVRSNNKALGSPVNRVNIMAWYAASGAVSNIRDDSWRGWFKRWLSKIAFSCQLALINLMYHSSQLWVSINRKFGRKVADFEEMIEATMQETIEKQLGLTLELDA